MAGNRTEEGAGGREQRKQRTFGKQGKRICGRQKLQGKKQQQRKLEKLKRQELERLLNWKRDRGRKQPGWQRLRTISGSSSLMSSCK